MKDTRALPKVHKLKQKQMKTSSKLSCRAQPVVKPEDRLLGEIENEFKSFLPALSPISSPDRPPAKISEINLISEPRVAYSIVPSPKKSKDLLEMFPRVVPVDLSLLAMGTKSAVSELEFTSEEIGKIFQEAEDF